MFLGQITPWAKIVFRDFQNLISKIHSYAKKMIINEFWYLMRKIDLLMTKLECFSCKFRKVSSKRKLILPIKSHSPFGIKLLMSPPLPSFRVRSSWKLKILKALAFTRVAATPRIFFFSWKKYHKLYYHLQGTWVVVIWIKSGVLQEWFLQTSVQYQLWSLLKSFGSLQRGLGREIVTWNHFDDINFDELAFDDYILMTWI